MKNSLKKFTVLVVDDESSVRSSITRLFLDNDYQIQTAGSGEEALELLKKFRVDAALIDLKMPGMDGLTLLREMRKANYPIMAIMLTGHGSIKEAVAAIKLGAVDFIEKPYSPEGLHARVAQLHQIWELKEENRALRSRIESRFDFDRLVGNSKVMLNLKRLIAQVSPDDAPVLIQGETGTGKELVARAIHHHSRRSHHNFVPVDCAAISETVIESELFGHVKGAFTGAHISTLGLVRSADQGTLFLDEVGELSPAIQVKLLRTIQESEVRPVGSSSSSKVDIRIISATNRDLAAEVANANFREDLFYRLNVLVLNVPSLRDRMDDVVLLAKYFVKNFATDFSTVEDISNDALMYLQNYNWPGNIRELENVIRRAIALGRDAFIQPEDLPAGIFTPPGKTTPEKGLPADDSLEAYEKAAIQNALAKCNDSRRKAAEILGIGEATLYRKITKYGLRI
jgi:DNA-binding NtrC family response regulator